MNVTLNPTDYDNIVSVMGEPPEGGDISFLRGTDLVERGTAIVTTDDKTDTVPLFVLGLSDAALDADERAAAAEEAGDLLSELLRSVFADKLVQMNPAEIARATELFGPSPVDVVGSDDVALGCTRIDGEEQCDPEPSIDAGVLARDDDGNLYVTSGAVADSDVEFSA